MNKIISLISIFNSSYTIFSFVVIRMNFCLNTFTNNFRQLFEHTKMNTEILALAYRRKAKILVYRAPTYNIGYSITFIVGKHMLSNNIIFSPTSSL